MFGVRQQQQQQQQQQLLEYEVNRNIKNSLLHSNNQASLLQSMKAILDEKEQGEKQFIALSQQYRQLNDLELECALRLQQNGNLQNMDMKERNHSHQQNNVPLDYYRQIQNVVHAQNALQCHQAVPPAQQRLHVAQQVRSRSLPNNGSVSASQFTSYDQQAHHILAELGKYLAVLQINVGEAISAGLLGGLGAGDLKILQEAHSAQLLLSTQGAPQNPSSASHLPCNFLVNNNALNMNNTSILNRYNGLSRQSSLGHASAPTNLPSNPHIQDYKRNGQPPVHDEEAFQARFANLCLGTGF